MADIKLFNIHGTVQELPSQQVALEKELQNLLEKNMQTFFGVTFLKSEYKITNGRMDSIGIDENNCPVIFEYKRSVNENVINQGLFYLDWLLDHKADFKLLVMEVLGYAKAEAIDWSMPCVICIANDFTKFDEHAVNQMQRNIKLVRYRKFGNDLIAFEHLNAPQVAPITYDYEEQQLKPTKKNAPKDKDFKQYFAEAGEDHQNLFYSIRDYVLSLGDDISENQLKLYVAFKKAKNFVCVEVYQSSLLCHLRLNPDTVDLIPGFTEDVRNKGHWGTGDLRVIIKNRSDLEKAIPLFDRAYNEN
jgi:predicted transport protein